MIERVTTYTPLGLRFWDAVADRQITEGLRVRAWPANRPPRRYVSAFRTKGGIYAFRDLPGLRALEYPVGDDVPFSSMVPRSYLVEVADQQRRFLPMRFEVDLPITEYSGVYRPFYAASPPQPDEARFYLFSAPARSAPTATAVIHAQLMEANSETPAAWACVEMIVDGISYFSYSDKRGCVAIFLPWPSLIIGSPPSGKLTEQCWEVFVQVRYRSKTAIELDDLWKIDRISQQPVANLYETTTSIAQPFLVSHLCYGQELIVKTEDPAARTTLWLESG